MDISGVDVDFLTDNEILDLCSNIIDCNSEEISVLKGIDVNNLSEDKVSELYDDVMYNVKKPVVIKPVPLTDKQVLDINYNTVDMEEDEIVVFRGKNINLDDLSNNDIIEMYDNLNEENVLIANDAMLLCTSPSVDPVYITTSMNMQCYDNSDKSSGLKTFSFLIWPTKAAYLELVTPYVNDEYYGEVYKYTSTTIFYDVLKGKGACTGYCSGYGEFTKTCISYVYNTQTTVATTTIPTIYTTDGGTVTSYTVSFCK